MLRPGHQSTDLYALKECFHLINTIIDKYNNEFYSSGFCKQDRYIDLGFSQLSLKKFDDDLFNKDIIANYNYNLSTIIDYKNKVSQEVSLIIEEIENLSIQYNEELYQSDSFSKVPPSRGNSILLSGNNHYKRVNESNFKVPSKSLILRQKILELAETYKDKGIKLSSIGHNKYMRYIIKKPTNAFSLPYGAKNEWFGLNILSIKKGISEFNNKDNPIHHNHGLYYKEYSRYHNCIGYVRYILEYGGINAFVNSKELEKFGVTDPSKLDRYIERVINTINHINSKAESIFSNNSKYLIINANNDNYLKSYKTYHEDRNINVLIQKYNAENADVFTTKKLSLLLQIVNKLNVRNENIAQKQFITDLAFEIKRLYSLS